jgi:hypothetical protein
VGAWLDVDVDWPALEALLRDGHALVRPVRRARVSGASIGAKKHGGRRKKE